MNQINSIKPKCCIYYDDLNQLSMEYAIKISNYLLQSKLVDYLVFEDDTKVKALQFINSTHIYLIKRKVDHVDLYIIIGDDEIVLKAYQLFQSSERCFVVLPFYIGKNPGSLAIYSLNSYQEILSDAFINLKSNLIKKKGTLLCECYLTHNNKIKWSKYCLNEVILCRDTNDGSGINDDLLINNTLFSTIICKSLIFSTPNSLYGIVSGTPLIYSDLEAYVINAVSPISLSFRPLILPRGITSKIIPSENPNKIQIKLDEIAVLTLELEEYIVLSIGNQNLEIVWISKYLTDNIVQWKKIFMNDLGWNTSFTH